MGVIILILCSVMCFNSVSDAREMTQQEQFNNIKLSVLSAYELCINLTKNCTPEEFDVYFNRYFTYNKIMTEIEK